MCEAGNAQGWVAQLVEQRTENPRVPGSIPGPATFSASTTYAAKSASKTTELPTFAVQQIGGLRERELTEHPVPW